jgi:hypothetical protein
LAFYYRLVEKRFPVLNERFEGLRVAFEVFGFLKG